MGQRKNKTTKKQRKLLNKINDNIFDIAFDDEALFYEDDDTPIQYTDYVCSKCGVHENIPTHIVMNFEFMDGGSDDYWPTFDCEKCNGLMYPVYFKGFEGKIYQYKLKD